MANKLVFNPFLKGNFDFVNESPELSIQPTLTLYVDNMRTDSYIPDGTILKPFKTIQSAIDSSSLFNMVIKVSPHRYDENLVFSNRENIQIEGYSVSGSSAVGIYGQVTIIGGTRIKFKCIDLRNPGGVSIDVHDSNGRFYLEDCDIQGDVKFNNVTNWSVINKCDITGSILLSNDNNDKHTLFLNHQGGSGCEIHILHPDHTVIASQCYRLGSINHVSGSISLYGVNFMEGDIDSSSNDGLLNISGVSFQKANLTYSKINKTGTCPYIISRSNRRISSDILTGPRYNYAQPSKDIEYDNSNSGLISTNVQDAIDELSGASVRKFQKAFSVADWVLDSGVYQITIPESEHSLGINPTVQIMELFSGEFEPVIVNEIKINSSGDIVINVLSSPDLRFNGKIIIL